MISTGTYIEPLDFKTILVDYFLGNLSLLVFALIIVLSYASAKYNLSNRIYLVLLVISTILFVAYIGEAIYALALFITGLVVFKLVARIVS